MKEVFGIPVDSLLVGLLVALALALGALAVLGLRNPVLVKLAVRSVGRRRGRSALIVVGQVAVQAPVQRQNEPSVVLFAADPARMAGFSPIRGSGGEELSLADLGAREVYLNARAARDLRVEPGARVVIYAGPDPVGVRLRDVVTFD